MAVTFEQVRSTITSGSSWRCSTASAAARVPARPAQRRPGHHPLLPEDEAAGGLLVDGNVGGHGRHRTARVGPQQGQGGTAGYSPRIGDLHIRLLVIASLTLVTAAGAPVESKPAAETPRPTTSASSPSPTTTATVRAAVAGTAERTTATSAVPGAICEFSGTIDPSIKGNVATDGERIYHVPGGEFYAVTVISATRGERMFCTEADARGWMASIPALARSRPHA